MRSTRLLPLALILAFALSVCGCQKPVTEEAEESTSEKTVSYTIEDIEKNAAAWGYTCKRKEDAGLREINEDINASTAKGNLVNCVTVSSSADHTGAIIFEFDSEKSASDFCEASESLLGKLSDGMSKDCRGRLFIYGNTSVIENI